GRGGRPVITPRLEAVAWAAVDDRARTIVTPAESVNSSPVGGRGRTVAKKAEHVATALAEGDVPTAVATPDPVASSLVVSSPPGDIPAAVRAPEPGAASSPPDGRVPRVVTAPEPPALAEPVVSREADTATETAIVPAPRVVAAPLAIGPVSGLRLRWRAAVSFIFLSCGVAFSLAGLAAFFSIGGLFVLFPGPPAAIVIMGVAMEAAKLVTVGFLAHQWRLLARLSRAVL